MNSLIELRVEKLVPGGLGLARCEGEVILLPGVLPGEKVKAELGERRRGVRRGRVVAVSEASGLRSHPDCPWAIRCGGCDFLHVKPEAALELKARAALGELAGSAGINLELVESPLRDRYRSRATLHLGLNGQGRTSIGFLPSGGAADGGGGLAEFEDCRLMAPELSELLAPLKDWASGLPPDTPPFDLALANGLGGSGRMICFSPPPRLTGGVRPETAFGRKGGPRGRRTAPSLRRESRAEPYSGGQAAAFRAELARLPRILADHGRLEVSVWARTKPGGPQSRISSGGPGRLTTAHWPQWDLSLSAAPGGFSQVNPEVNRLMVEKILHLAAPLKAGGTRPRALDLYSGLGNIALPLLKSGFSVTAPSPGGV